MNSRLSLSVLASGSEGNCAVVSWTCETGSHRIIIDAGISPRAMTRRMAEIDEPPTGFRAILLTHAHQDHCQYAQKLAAFACCPIYARAGVLERVGNGRMPLCGINGNPLAFHGLEVEPIPLSHTADSLGFSVTDPEGRKILICYDLGVITPQVADAARGSQVIAIESNYSQSMMATSPYDARLIERIESDSGHLSNTQVSRFLRSVAPHSPDLHTVLLMHISDTNNSPFLAEASARAALQGREVRVLVAPQNQAVSIEV